MKKKIKIGILNLMPKAEKYMQIIHETLPDSVDIIWLRLKNHPYKSSDQDILTKTHVTFSEVSKHTFHGFILTGAPLDKLDYFGVNYWWELSVVLTEVYKQTHSILGICWGAMALGKIFFNIEKDTLAQKIFGVFSMFNIASTHPLFHSIDSVFHCPQSRYATMNSEALQDAIKQGLLLPLDYSPILGYNTLSTPDTKLVLHQGHFEYPTLRLAEEYWRDYNSLQTRVELPINYSLKKPNNNWQLSSCAFFKAWIELISQKMEENFKSTAL